MEEFFPSFYPGFDYFLFQSLVILMYSSKANQVHPTILMEAALCELEELLQCRQAVAAILARGAVFLCVPL